MEFLLSEPISNTGALLASDIELNGSLSQASSQGAKFSLLLAMLQQDYCARPTIQSQRPEQQQADSQLASLSCYRQPPLKASAEFWQQAVTTCQLVHQGAMGSLHLWQAMHPQALSQFNDVKRLDQEVVMNCALPTQLKLQQAEQNQLAVDETALYDVLQTIERVEAA